MKRLFSTFLLMALIGLGITAVSHHSPSSLAAIDDTAVSVNVTFFVNSGQSLGGATGNGVALGDLNGSGYLDAFVANDHTAFGEANQVWFNDGSGFFSAGPTLGDFDGYAVALGDLDGDGDLDAVVGGSEGNFVWINQGGAQGGQPGTFLPGALLGAAGYGVAIGDVNSNGHLDVLIAGNSNQLWLNNGDATFTADFTFPFQFSRSVVLADLDGDGWLDAIIADSAFGTNSQVWWNDGNWNPGPGSFSPGPLLPMANLANAVAVADLDNDGLPDIFLAGSGPNQIFWNEGQRTFSTAGPLPLNDNSSAVALADLDGDGLVDAVVGNTHAQPNHVWRNEGNRVFTMGQEFGHETGISWGRGLALGDLTGDGSPDLFEATTADDRVWFNTAASPPIANEEGWQVQLVATRGRAGLFPGLTLDAAGHPHVSYVRYRLGPDDTQIYDLIYTFWDGRRWQRQFVTRHNYMDRGDLANNTAIALDSQGRPHILYVAGDGPFAFADQVLKYAVWTGSTWQVETVDDSQGDIYPGVALAVDSQDRPHLSYARREPSYYVARYAVRTMAGWQLEQVEAVNGGDVGRFSSLVLDGNDQPHISYTDELDNWVKYARKTGGGWQIETVAGMGTFLNHGFTSLALDGAEQPHIIFISDAQRQLHYAAWNGSEWQVQIVYESDPWHTLAGQTSLALDGDGRPHTIFVERGDIESLRYARWDGAAWQIEVVDNKGQVGRTNSMALDGNDAPHVAYYDARFSDLRLAHWGPRWVHGPVDESGVLLAPSLTLADQTPAVGYYNQSSGQVKGALWNGAWEIAPVAFVNNEVTATSLATSLAGQHMSYYDADTQNLVYAVGSGGQWTAQVVDGSADVGRYNRLLLVGANSSNPGARIAYWDATSWRIKLALLDPGEPIQIVTNLAGPPLNNGSGPLDISLLSGGQIGISYYDAVNGNLRLATWQPGSQTWSDELITSANNVGSLHALQTDATTAQPVVAFYDAASQAIGYTYRTDDGWLPPQTAVANVAQPTSLDMVLGFESLDRPRLLFTTEENRLYWALKQDGIWQVELVAEADTSLGNARLALGDRPFLAYTQAGSLQLAHRTATLDVTSSVPNPERTGGAFNILDACAALVNFFFDASLHRLTGFHSQPPTLAQDPLPEPALFAALHALFATSAGGSHYINAYAQHGAEMGQVGLQDPALLWDAYGTLQNFLPGLEGLVSGQGDQFVVTQEMVDDALDIWQRLAAAGSPELAATINSELMQYNNLQDFVGLSFNEWAMAIGVNPPSQTIYLPVVVRP